MNKLLKLAAVFACLVITQYGFADDNYSAPVQGNVQQGCCPADHPAEDQNACGDRPAGECYCLMVRYKPCYYTTKRCVQECIPCKKKCYRCVPKYYEVKKCRMVPEYYCETACKYEKECYEVDDTKYVTKTVCDQHCKYVPEYYWKHTGCAPAAQACDTGCPR